jgi:aminopeptidase N
VAAAAVAVVRARDNREDDESRSPAATAESVPEEREGGSQDGAVPRAGAAGVGDRYYPGLGNGGYDAGHYTVALTWRPISGTVDGVTTIEATTTQALSRFNLDLSGLEVATVEVDGEQATFDRNDDELLITPAVPLADGASFTTVVTYEGQPEPERFIEGLPELGWITNDGGAYVIAEPAGAATFFPSNNHPSDKARFTFEITVPDGLDVAANGLLRGKRPNGDATTWVFDLEDPMATYLVQVAIGDFVFEEEKGPGGVILRNAFAAEVAEDASNDFARQAEMIDVLDDAFGPYPFDVYGVVVVDEELGLALETQTLSIYGTDLVDGEGGSDAIYVHELAHEWYGNSVSIEQWADIWLAEGFATYAEWLWMAHDDDRDVGDIAREVAEEGGAVLDEPPTDPGADNPFTPSIYQRGALTLQALREEVGDDTFFEILSTWSMRYRFANATTADFTALAEDLADRSLDGLFQAWLFDEELPELAP